MNFLKKLLPILFYSLLWGLVVYYVEPPKSWPEATPWQILAFFVPLTLALTFVINLILNYFPHSFMAALGLLMLLVLYAINQLTIISAATVLLITVLFIKLFPRVRLLPRIKFSKILKLLRITKS